MPNGKEISIAYFFILNNKQFEPLYNSEGQIIWGIISAIPRHKKSLSNHTI